METCPRDHTTTLHELGLATGTAWEALSDLDLLSAHDEVAKVTVAEGTRMRVEQSLAATNIGFRTVLFRLFILEGPRAGECVWLETDERAANPHYGLWPAL
jgi:hypothetical protein